MFLDFHVICFVNLPPAGVFDLKMEITDVAATLVQFCERWRPPAVREAMQESQ